MEDTGRGREDGGPRTGGRRLRTAAEDDLGIAAEDRAAKSTENGTVGRTIKKWTRGNAQKTVDTLMSKDDATRNDRIPVA